ncbi:MULTISPECIES: hypothetical protein [Caldilinea]|uniref:Uncharacterized protein n=1 Tax=Caldilinea aerophila (strain DSM 14535 / JCM 11387 / NBRC 104270 / STL-6-O1) TaxID=926550 RepID=I0I7Y8_CALAS|nr:MULTISPECIES: hypothetical protein [Caldilinea]BAM01376.1 hypothetical protein CLDAP_33360 [Caldilinea aerophila DSM 14535 = NBRC 104270]GIV72716.1 MAG: hypothetical protein KatS3mg049_1272 [Caldilinea sp.]
MRIQGRYRVSLNGFRCNNSTWDDALNRDGFGDEVFFQIEYRYVDGNGSPMGEPVRRVTRTIGAPGDGRYAFGSARDIWGNLQLGIASGDEFPGPSPFERRNPFPNPEDVPPLLIWEGDLVSDWEGDHTDYWIGRRVTHENIVFITSTIWERDPGEDAMTGWLRWLVAADEKFGDKAREIVSGVWPLTAPVFDAVSLGIQTGATLPEILGQAGTRPIGTMRDATVGELLFTPQVLDLTQARAEEMLARNEGYGVGVRPFHYRDADIFRGDYVFWLQVERVGILRELPPLVGTAPSPLSGSGGGGVTLSTGGIPLAPRPRL